MFSGGLPPNTTQKLQLLRGVPVDTGQVILSMSYRVFRARSRWLAITYKDQGLSI